MGTDQSEVACVICQRLAVQGLEGRYERVYSFRYSLAVLHPVQVFRGHCELWLAGHARELFELKPAVRRGFLEEMNVLAGAVAAVTGARKMNYELLGNVVPHVHWHIVPRYETDPLPEKPIWVDPRYAEAAGGTAGAELSAVERRALAGEIRREIERLFSPGMAPGIRE